MAHYTLQLYNTLSRKKEPIRPSIKNHIGLYVCGVTVYDHCHVGHARVWVVFDVLVRYLNQAGYTVNYVRNITDIDDKIIQRAFREKEEIQSLTSRMVHSMHEDMQALQLLRPTHEPRATQYISKMIQLIQTLIYKNYAYLGRTGDVYYRVSRFEGYGQLAQQSLSELLVGARISADSEKKDPLDFVLWKRIEDTDTIAWESPWGRGRPGWHLECSAMALHHLGESFDIHGGGVDLKFPHHQNEIAQSEAITQQPLAKHWMHVGFVEVNQDKMSKSLGNALTIKTVLQQYSGEVVRYFLLTSHYRSPLNYQPSHLKAAATSLKRLYQSSRTANRHTSSSPPVALLRYKSNFHKALEDDLNTPVALSVLFDLARHINRLGDHADAIHFAKLLKTLGGLLGLLQQENFTVSDMAYDADTTWVEDAIQQRERAREQKQWALADNIRKALLDKGISLKDTKDSTHWCYTQH